MRKWSWTKNGFLKKKLGIYFLKLINNSSSDKPIACPHLGHMDVPWYRGKEQHVWISKHVCLEIN